MRYILDQPIPTPFGNYEVKAYYVNMIACLPCAYVLFGMCDELYLYDNEIADLHGCT